MKARRRRQRALRVALAAVGGAVILAAVVVAVMLVTRSTPEEAGASTTTASVAVLAGSTILEGSQTSGSSGATTAGSLAATTSGPTSSSSTGPAGGTGAATTPGTTAETGISTTSGGGVGSTLASTSSTLTISTTTTSTRSTTTSTSPVTSTTARQTGFVVCIDPGHQAHGNSAGEPVGPGSKELKAKVSDGTAGVATGVPESKLNLAVGLKLADALRARGITVVMTRTTQDVNLSNIQRAEIANQAHADLFVRIHADGSDDHSVHGIHVLYPASIEGWTDGIAAMSKRAAELAQKYLIAATGAANRGIDERSDMTGFNWSKVPVILPEIGFMSNPSEDRLLETAAYQDKIVSGLTQAILAFLGVS